MFEGRIPFWVLPVLFVFAVVTVAVRLSVVRTTYSINQIDRMLRNLQVESEQSALQLAKSRSARNLEGIAKSKFKLQKPRSDQVVRF